MTCTRTRRTRPHTAHRPTTGRPVARHGPGPPGRGLPGLRNARRPRYQARAGLASPKHLYFNLRSACGGNFPILLSSCKVSSSQDVMHSTCKLALGSTHLLLPAQLGKPAGIRESDLKAPVTTSPHSFSHPGMSTLMPDTHRCGPRWSVWDMTRAWCQRPIRRKPLR